jgi:hypothetical protein
MTDFFWIKASAVKISARYVAAYRATSKMLIRCGAKRSELVFQDVVMFNAEWVGFSRRRLYLRSAVEQQGSICIGHAHG